MRRVADRASSIARRRPARTGRRTAHLPIAGLDPTDALALADHILGDLGIAPSIPFRELQGLLGRLGHSPLAIQLILPLLRNVHRAKLQVTIDGLLQGVNDASAAVLPRELTAALRLWFGRFPEAAHGALKRLTVFAGGADERRALVVADVPEADWADLRVALEQGGLLTVERPADVGGQPFLRFHQALVSVGTAGGSKVDGDTAARFITLYLDLAASLATAGSDGSEISAAELRRELPNLERALDLAASAGDAARARTAAVVLAPVVERLVSRREAHRLRSQWS